MIWLIPIAGILLLVWAGIGTYNFVQHQIPAPINTFKAYWMMIVWPYYIMKNKEN